MRVLGMLLFLGACASSGAPADGGADRGMPSCAAVGGLPSSGVQGAFDPARNVTWVFSLPAQTPLLSLLVESFAGMGADSFPASADFSSSTRYKSCPSCVTLATCTPSGCTPEFLAQAGHVQVDDASRDAANGHMKATVSGIEFVAWDFVGDQPAASGHCVTLDSATLEASWTRLDGGMPDLAVPVDLSPPLDLAINHDLAGNPDLAMSVDLSTIPDLAMSIDLSTSPDLSSSPDMAQPADMTSLVDLASTCHPVINEVQTGGAGGGSDEWVEIYDPCSTTFTGWKLLYRSAGNSQSTLFNFTTQSGPYILVAGGGYVGPPTADGSWGAGVGLGPNGGAVGLVDALGTLIDSVSYGTLTATNNFTETSPAPNPPSGQSIARDAMSTDSNNNSTDFTVATTPTPKAKN